MKNTTKLLASIIAIILPTMLYGQVRYTVKGRLGQVSAPAKVYLMHRLSEINQIDSAEVKNGYFVFSGIVEDPVNAFLILNKNGNGVKSGDYTELYLENGSITVNSPDLAKDAAITGGVLNTDNEKFKLVLKPVELAIDNLVKEYQLARKENKKPAAFADTLQKRFDSLEQREKQTYLNFIKANPGSPLCLFLMKDYAGNTPDITDLEVVFNSLSPEVKNSKKGKAYARQLSVMKKTAVGANAPDFTMADTAGRTVSLHDFRGKYVLIDFWASWCPPCRQENPNVVAAYNAYKDKGFTVIGISLDETNGRSSWMKAIHQDHLTWTQLSDLKYFNNAVAPLYAVTSIPQNFLIGPDGKIVAQNLHGRFLKAKLKELLH